LLLKVKLFGFFVIQNLLEYFVENSPEIPQDTLRFCISRGKSNTLKNMCNFKPLKIEIRTPFHIRKILRISF